MTERGIRVRLWLVVLAVFAIAVATRTGPLYWSPLPATLDGFRYVSLADQLLATGQLPMGAIESDELVFTLVLAAGSLTTGVDPLALVQPLVAVAGAAGPLIGVAIVVSLTRERGWAERRVVGAAALTGIGLAVDGIFLRRTGVPDEEAFGLLLVPLLALAAHRWLTSGHRGWGALVGVLVVALPPLHNLSSLLGVLSVTGLVALHGVRARSTAGVARSLALGMGGWLVFLGYFEAASRLGLELTYSGLLRPYPGLFAAWVIALVGGVLWVRTTSQHLQRLGLFLPVGGFFLLLVANAVRPVFPGTMAAPPLVLALLAAFTVPVAFAVIGVPVIARGTGQLVLATLTAPLVFTYYALSAELTPAFFSAVIRVQSFAHLPAFILAAVGVLTLTGRVRRSSLPARRVVASGVVLVFVLGVALTLPLGYLNLDTGSAPSTTFPAELESSGFATAHVQGSFTTDHSLAQVVTHYHTPLGPPPAGMTGRRATYLPTRAWLLGGPPPACPMLSQRSWTTTGAHLYPTPPATVSPTVYERTLATRHVVYAVGGADPARLSLPTSASGDC